ncbi:DoxX family protein [Streptomyces sp. 150FB]|uniref:DoxX family protein n=1 Tax=Streptomyces sp. 150FB TaxID=1576605 RepID=UPI00058914D1|nr:DoxX family protein [Streptomyces sp. 150FB]KIF74264.1 DoxX family protein [Streptomyces sp. 150FB]
MNARLTHAQPYTLGLFRMVLGLLFTCHGAAALFGFFGQDAVPAGTWPNWYASVIQLVAGVLVFVGLGTRTAALVSSGSMAYAYFTVHQPHGLFPIENGGEAPVFFCWAFLLVVFTGPGALALDRLFSSRADNGVDADGERQQQRTAVAA